MADHHEVVHERLYLREPRTERLRKGAAGHLRHLLATGWRETERWHAEDYITVAHAKGLSESLVLLRHVLRNALLSTVTIFGLQFGFLVGGAIVIETVFALPGTGQLLIQSITARDYPVVQAITVVSAVLVIVVNLVVDLSYSVLDPRVTYE